MTTPRGNKKDDESRSSIESESSTLGTSLLIELVISSCSLSVSGLILAFLASASDSSLLSNGKKNPLFKSLPISGKNMFSYLDEMTSPTMVTVMMRIAKIRDIVSNTILLLKNIAGAVLMLPFKEG